MSHALARFSVRHGGLHVRVRLLATISEVDAEFRAGRRRQKGIVVHGFFAPAGAGARRTGDIVIPCDADLMEIVPHEVTHAVMHHLGGADCTDDEEMATAVGLLTARIFRELARRGLGA